jgi:anti-sigma B factor antagonist
MSLQIASRVERSGVYVVSPAGSLDSDTYPILEKHIEEILNVTPAVIVLDMESVDYISSAGVRIILKTKKDLKKTDGALILANLQPQVEKVLDIINALQALKVISSAGDLNAYLDDLTSRNIK